MSMKRNRPLNLEKREAIIKAAVAEFSNKGYEGSSMDTISKEANVSKATVYNHFTNKEELFLAIAFMLKDRFAEAFQYKYSHEKAIKEQLKELALKEMHFLSSQENITLIQIVTIVLIQKNEIGLKLYPHVKEDNLLMSIDWFEQASKDGKLNIDDPSFVSRQFMGMIKSFAYYPQLYGADILSSNEQEHLVDKVVEMILKLYG